MQHVQYNLFVTETGGKEQLIPSNTTKIPLTPFNEFEKIAGVDISKIKAINLTQFRNSNLPVDFYWLLALPIVGWVALVCLKINYIIKNTRAEQIMKESHYDSVEIKEKIKILKHVIEKSGPLAWQYQLELARLQLLNEDRIGADATLKEINKQRGFPRQTGWYNVKDKGLVSFEIAPESDWSDGKNVIKITHYTAEEALIHANVHIINGRLAAAYDSYNQAIYYNDLLKEEIRPYQVALAKKMQESKNILTGRALKIIEAEIDFTDRQERAKKGVIGR